MPTTLHNHTEADVYCAALHVMVPAGSSVEIADEDADKVNLDSGVFTTTVTAGRHEVTRGSKQVEVDDAPQMETRG